ncbi:hypothetical protein ACHHYP_20680 [Achlya hypogyna]|uniref:Tyr recombinase domain-containing protein n=1 Tax=Achlya hypogyna TaxID=1202772 RepID=A0A1V9YF31_ACHHY|nr:hypothetical protein ACHHYP_20680 [Achlya hypogyna]
MCRGRSTQTIHLEHLSVHAEAIGIIFCKPKTDQSATKRRGPATFTATQWKRRHLFPGSAQKDRFGKQLSNLLSDSHTPCGRAEYGTHSIRKGAVTFVCWGITSGLSIISVCLRCGWSLGNVLERFMHY